MSTEFLTKYVYHLLFLKTVHYMKKIFLSFSICKITYDHNLLYCISVFIFETIRDESMKFDGLES